MTNALNKTLAAIFVLVTIGACSILPESDPVQLLDPRLPGPETAAQGADWALNIARPEADPARDSNRVLIRTGQGQLQVHASARWIAPAPELLRTLLVRYLRDSGRLREVSAGAAGQDRTLVLDLRQFELNESGGDQLQAQIRVEAGLYDSRSSELLARRLFESRQSTASAQPDRILSGFEAALGEIIPALADWVTGHGSPDHDR